MDKTFNVKDYWRFFEILSVKIVKIQIKETLAYTDLDFFETQVPLTRDHGIDGQLKIVLDGNDILITVEAKLRSKGPLGLKDFASSLVNYLINLSDIHYVVTNVEFSNDAKEVLNGINKQTRKNCLNYIDGPGIQKIISQNEINDILPEHKSQIEALISYINSQKFSTVHPTLLDSDKLSINKKILDSTYILPRNEIIENDLKNLLNKCHTFLLVEGDMGVGKSFVIKRVLDSLRAQFSIIPIDLSSHWSNQTLVVEIMKCILHLDFFQILSLLTCEEKEEIKHEIIDYQNVSEDYLKALKQLLSFETTETLHFNYLIKIFLKNILEKVQSNFILYLFNSSEIAKQTSNFFLNLLPEIADKVKIIIEVDKLPFITDKNKVYKNFVDSIQQYSYKGIPVTTYIMSECKKTEAEQYVKYGLLDEHSDDFVNYICSKYGCNLLVLTDVIDYINSNLITTQVEVNKMPLIQYGRFTESTLKQYIQNLLPSLQKALFWGIVIINEMDGYLNYSLIEKLEDHLKIDNLAYFFIETSLFKENDDKLIIKSKYHQKILLSLVPVYNIHQAFKFLLKNKEDWDIPELQSSYKETCLLLALKKDNAILKIDSFIEILEKQNLKEQKRHLLYLCYQFYAQRKDNRIKELQYLLRYLESILEELKYCDVGKSELIDKADILCRDLIIKSENNISCNLYELQIRIYFLYYNKQKTKFRFDLAEKYIDKALALETYCDDIELIGKIYWCKGLCLKERGVKPGFLNTMLDGIKKYPHAIYLKICYLSNYASSNFKTDLTKSYKALKAGIRLAEMYNYMDLEVWLSNNVILCNLTEKNFSNSTLEKILKLRQKADRYELLSDISRSYNNEAVWQWKNGNLFKSLQCLEHALNIFDDSVTDQQKFLFRVNKILLLWKTNNKITTELNYNFNWLKQNYMILVNKLNSVSTTLKKENNYAAILSLYRISYLANEFWFCKKLEEWFKYPVFESIKNEVNTDIIDYGFIVNDEIFILF